MLKFLRILPVLALVGGCASTTPAAPSNRPTSAPAIQFEPGPGPYNLDWNIAGGKYRETDLRIPGQQIKVSGTVQFVALNPDRTWSPMASVDLVAPKDADSVRFMLFPDSANPDQIRVSVYPKRPGSSDSEDLGFLRAGANPIPFEVVTAKPGEFKLSLAGKLVTTVNVAPYEVSRVRLAGSTAHLRLENIVVSSLK
jgi:hypothetical protein